MSKISEAVYVEMIRSATDVVVRAEWTQQNAAVIQVACKFLQAHFAIREPLTEEQQKARYEAWRAMMTPKADEPVTVEGSP